MQYVVYSSHIPFLLCRVFPSPQHFCHPPVLEGETALLLSVYKLLFRLMNYSASPSVVAEMGELARCEKESKVGWGAALHSGLNSHDLKYAIARVFLYLLR